LYILVKILHKNTIFCNANTFRQLLSSSANVTTSLNLSENGTILFYFYM